MAPKQSVNPYDVLGLVKTCTEKEIQKAYKLQCLRWHPDKNLDNKEEAEKKFIAAKEAFEFLYDKQKREEYDKGVEKVRVRDERQRERMEKADSARKKHINDLLEREKQFAERRADPTILTPAQEAAKKRQNEIRIKADFEELRKRLEKEAEDELHVRHEKVRIAMREEKNTEKQDSSDASPKLRLKWAAPEAGVEDYDATRLRKMFEPYGCIVEISSILPIKKGKMRMCVIEFSTDADAWGAELETGTGPTISADWLIKPAEVSAQPAAAANNTEEIPAGEDFASMTFEELEAKLFADMAPAEKRRKWHEDEEENDA